MIVSRSFLRIHLGREAGSAGTIICTPGTVDKRTCPQQRSRQGEGSTINNVAGERRTGQNEGEEDILSRLLQFREITNES